MIDTEPNALQIDTENPAPAMEIALDIVKRAAVFGPIALVACAAIWGINGAFSGAYALAIVVVNFLISAWLLQTAGRISAVAMGGAALFGYLVRLGLIFVAFLLAKDAGWMEILPFGLVLIVTHLGLLFWELKYVSGSLAAPGLKPKHH